MYSRMLVELTECSYEHLRYVPKGPETVCRICTALCSEVWSGTEVPWGYGIPQVNLH